MSEFGDLVQSKCDAFADRVVKLNDYLLKEAANQKADVRWLMEDGKKKKVYVKPIPVYLQAVANICNQLLRSGTSVGANNSEATSAISKADYKSKSYIALKEARESLYWINLLHRNSYLDDKQYDSIYADADELVRILVASFIKKSGLDSYYISVIEINGRHAHSFRSLIEKLGIATLIVTDIDATEKKLGKNDKEYDSSVITAKGKGYKTGNPTVKDCTFTNAATDEIINRLDYSPYFHISTIHSFVWDVIRFYQADIKRLYCQYIQEDIAELEAKLVKAVSKTTKTYLSNLEKCNGLKERYEKAQAIDKFVYNPNGSNPEYNALKHAEVMDLPIDMVKGYDDYVNHRSRFDTHQGVKGLEFERVMVIIDDSEARGFMFSYDKLFGVKDLTETDLKNISEGKETSIERTQRLFYVTCTRAKQSLAVVMYTKDPEKVKNESIRKQWFEEGEIDLI